MAGAERRFGTGMLLCAAGLAFASEAGAEACLGAPIGAGRVVAQPAPTTLELDDGRMVALALVVLAEGAAPALEGEAVILYDAGAERDRHGRLPAHVAVRDEAVGMAWLQHRLIRDGFARVASFEDQRVCAKELLVVEAEARAEARGLWRDREFAVRDAEMIEDLSRQVGTFQIVEGRVLAVATVRGTTYLNFGRDYRSDFTIIVSRGAAGLLGGEEEIETVFEGRRVRVRGWIEDENGPAIRLTHPEQISLVDAR